MNREASAISVTLDGPRKLLLDFNAFVAFSEATGQELPDVLAGLCEKDESGEIKKDKDGSPVMSIGKFTSKQLRAIVWSGLVHEDEALTIQHVGRYLGLTNKLELIGKIFMSLSGTEETPDPTSAEGAESPNDGTGIKSVPSATSNLALVVPISGD